MEVLFLSRALKIATNLFELFCDALQQNNSSYHSSQSSIVEVSILVFDEVSVRV